MNFKFIPLFLLFVVVFTNAIETPEEVHNEFSLSLPSRSLKSALICDDGMDDDDDLTCCPLGCGDFGGACKENFGCDCLYHWAGRSDCSHNAAWGVPSDDEISLLEKLNGAIATNDEVNRDIPAYVEFYFYFSLLMWIIIAILG